VQTRREARWGHAATNRSNVMSAENQCNLQDFKNTH